MCSVFVSEVDACHAAQHRITRLIREVSSWRQRHTKSLRRQSLVAVLVVVGIAVVVYCELPPSPCFRSARWGRGLGEGAGPLLYLVSFNPRSPFQTWLSASRGRYRAALLCCMFACIGNRLPATARTPVG